LRRRSARPKNAVMSSALAKGAWVVTGAASGLGQHFVRRLAERGESVSAWDRDPAGLERTRALWSGARLDSRVVDVTDPDAVERAAAAARAVFVGRSFRAGIALRGLWHGLR